MQHVRERTSCTSDYFHCNNTTLLTDAGNYAKVNHNVISGTQKELSAFPVNSIKHRAAFFFQPWKRRNIHWPEENILALSLGHGKL